MARMKTGRGKRIALATAVVGLAVLGATAYAFRDRIREEYWLWRFEQSTGAAREAAAAQLVECASLRAMGPIMNEYEGSAGPFVDALANLTGSRAFSARGTAGRRCLLARLAARKPAHCFAM